MHPKFIIRNIIEGCFFKLLNKTTEECFNYASSEHDEDEVIIMSESTGGLENMLTPMCNIYPKEEFIMVMEAFTMDLLPKQMKMYGNFWLGLLKQKETNIEFLYIRHSEGQLIECVDEIEI